MVNGGGPFREAPFRPEAELSRGTCPWCGADVVVDATADAGVCATCGARFATDAARGRIPRVAEEPAPVVSASTEDHSATKMVVAKRSAWTAGDAWSIGAAMLGLIALASPELAIALALGGFWVYVGVQPATESGRRDDER